MKIEQLQPSRATTYISITSHTKAFGAATAATSRLLDEKLVPKTSQFGF